MNKFMLKTPEGTRDFLFEECERHNRIKAALSALFAARGYNEVITPATEYFDLFSGESSGLSQEEMYKLTSRSGRLLVLRPDITMPIARLVSTRLKDAPLPIRLHYTQKVFRVNPGFKGRSDEITQSGVELIGAAGLTADLEMIHTAARVFAACGITDYKIELGHAGVFKALCAGLGVDPAVQEEIRLATESKSYSTLEEILERLPKTGAAKAVGMLPRLFGGVEILDEAAALFGETAAAELSYLRELVTALSPEYGDKISVDLGLVHRNNYYTGVVLRGYAGGSGDTAVSGGRYDHLFGEFGMQLPAVGFAANNQVLAEAMAAQEESASRPERQLVYPEPGHEMQALRYIDENSSAGLVLELMDFSRYPHAAEDAAQRGASAVVRVGKGIEIEAILSKNAE